MAETSTQITDKKKRYSAGVLKYKQMGYWMPDYTPKDTDTICLFRITPQEGVDPEELIKTPDNAQYFACIGAGKSLSLTFNVLQRCTNASLGLTGL